MARGDRGGKSKGSGKRCVAANCGNTNADGVSLHKFPKNPAFRKQWTDFVRVKRAKWDGPTEYSQLCSKHFKDDCFPFSQQFQMEQMGANLKRRTVNDDAVPTIHSEPPATETCSKDDTCTASTSTSTPRQKFKLEMLSPGEESTSQASPPKKLRRVYQKREATRILNAHINEENIDCGDQLALPLEEHADDECLEDDISHRCVSFGCQVKIQPKKRSKLCQTTVKEKGQNITSNRFVSIGCQTDESCIGNTSSRTGVNMRNAFAQVKPHYFDQKNQKESPPEDEIMSSPVHEEIDDSDYEPPSPTSSISEDDINRPEVPSIEDRNIYLVYEEELLELFHNCRKCCADTSPTILYKNGTLIKIGQTCHFCNYERFWYSQPFVGGKPAGNVAVSTSILFSGSIPTKVLKLFNLMNLACISISTFLKHQKYYLFPAIGHVWHNYQTDYLNDVIESGKSVILGGDGRADTPGHSAKYGSYTMLDLEEGIVVDLQLVQSNEVKSSSHMEKEGLERSVNIFNTKGVQISALVTDRHIQINKWVRENMMNTIHYFDVWHVAKGLKKKLLALAKEKDCSELQPWIRSITNHLYWTAASTQEEDHELMKAKWLSLTNHIANKHTGHGDKFHQCSHGPLEGRERKKKWLKPGTKVYEKLTDLVTSRQMMKDVPRLSPGQQTSCLEGFHSVINQFAPKMIGFSFHGMYARLWLAALHFNENVNRAQAVTKEGVPRYRIVYPKFKKGGYTVRKIPVECTYDYIEPLKRTVFEMASLTSMNEDAIQLLIRVPPPLCDQYERPDKEEAVRQVTSRFNLSAQGSQCSSGQGQGTCSGSL